MASLQPVVLEVTSIAGFLEHLLSHHAHPTTLLVCAAKDAFIAHLAHERDENSTSQMSSNVAVRQSQTPRFARSLRMLALSQSITVAFCQDVAQLRAYLATYANTVLERDTDTVDTGLKTKNSLPTLAVLNLVELHRGSSAFSAQGLNRSMALAVEAAHRSHARLAIIEFPLRTSDDRDMASVNISGNQSEARVSSLWAEEVSMLNVTTKKFGVGDQGWTGRTVSLKAIATRWCSFEHLPALAFDTRQE